MKRPAPVVLVTVALAGVAALAGLRLGLREPVSETDVIRAAAARYVAETGGRATDCIGVPGGPGIWIEVSCGSGSAVRSYLYGPDGLQTGGEGDPET